jgi:hypothetical protein
VLGLLRDVTKVLGDAMQDVLIVSILFCYIFITVKPAFNMCEVQKHLSDSIQNPVKKETSESAFSICCRFVRISKQTAEHCDGQI